MSNDDSFHIETKLLSDYFFCFSSSKKCEATPSNQNSFVSNKRNRDDEYPEINSFNHSIISSSEGPVTRFQFSLRNVLQNQILNNNSSLFRRFPSQSEKRTMAAEKSTKKTEEKKSTKLKRPFKIENTEERLEHEEENIHNINANRDNNNNNSRIINTRTTLPNTSYIKLIKKNNEQRNPSKNKKDELKRKDNARNTVKSWFFKSILNYVVKEYKKLRNIKLKENEFSWIKLDIQRMLPIENELSSKENFSCYSISSKKVKDIFYTKKNPESFYIKNTQKTKRYMHIEDFKKCNNINKKIINHIEDMYDKINEINNRKIKDIISLLYNILNSNLNTMFGEYIYMDDKKKPENFESIRVELDNLGQEKSDDYLIVLAEEAFKLAYE